MWAIAFVQNLWQNSGKMQIFYKNELIHSRRSHVLEQKGGPGEGQSKVAPFGWGRRDAGCPQGVSLDPVGTVGDPGS